MALMVSISGIRGIVGESITPETVVKYSSAFAEYCGRGTIILGRDGRSSGKLLANIASSTLLAMGCNVRAIGICPTPTVQLAVEHSDAVGGIAITASHNPSEWNGMKFIGSHGMFLDNEENARFLALAEKPHRHYARWERLGSHTADESYLQKHIEAVLKIPFIDVERIRKRKMKVVVDGINAAGGVVVPQLLRDLGCTVVELNCEVSGIFARPPEPIPENLSNLCRRVVEEKADLGIAVDPDVDRLVLITERGEPFGEELTVTGAVRYVLEKIAPSPSISPESPTVVVNLSTTRAVDDIAANYRTNVIRTPVGEINVARKMKETGALIGGEGSGGVILPAVHYGRDALVGIALLLSAYAEFGGTLSEFKSTFPAYTIVKRKIRVDAVNTEEIMENIRARLSGNGRVNREDGLRIDFERSWIHMRKSNTEPIIRIIAEAPTEHEAAGLIEKALATAELPHHPSPSTI